MNLEGTAANKRRRHKNSKNGCPNCKKRRVKCSEDLPQCKNCIKHKVKCGYLDYTPQQIQELQDAKDAIALANSNNDDDDDKSSTSISIEAMTKDNNNNSSSSKLSTSRHSSTHSLIDTDHRMTDSQPFGLNRRIEVDTNLPIETEKIASSISESVIQSNLMEMNFDDVPDNRRHNLAPASTDQADVIFMEGGGSATAVEGYNVDHQVVGNSHKKVFLNYDNVNLDPNNIIMYPVYSLGKEHSNLLTNIDPHSMAAYAQLSHVTSLDDLSGIVNPAIFGQYISSNNNNNNNELAQFDSSSSAGASITSNLLHSSEHGGINFEPHTIHDPKSLPGSIKAPARFEKLNYPDVDYRQLIHESLTLTIAKLGNLNASLSEIRNLYKTWLLFFYATLPYLPMLFLSLINFLTNYLISNFFEGSKTEKLSLSDKQKLKNQLVVISIKHYGIVIKGIRDLLKMNNSPEICSLILYILLLMLIYDPEATANSTKCFRDGLFLVLLHYADKETFLVPALIPAHLHLMKNIVRLVYLPGYNPLVVEEYVEVLYLFGELIPPQDTWIVNKFNALYSYVRDVQLRYIPRINQNLDNVEEQHQLLFEMLHRWVRIFPSTLVNYSKTMNPYNKVLYLFFGALRRVLFAICPHIRFCLLKDFDKALFMDMDDTDFASDVYEDVALSPQFKEIAIYLIRIGTFFSLRTLILYSQIVRNKKIVTELPINDIRKWHGSITSIRKARETFLHISGITEIPILRFKDILIQPCHYPHVYNMEMKDPTHSVPDFNTFQRSGLLENDFRPKFELIFK